MRKPQASTALALLLSAAGTIGGCSANTNTLDLDSGNRHYAFRKAEIDELMADGRAFAVLPRDSRNVSVQGRVLGSEAVLGFQLVPYDNSKRIRTPEELKVVPKDEKYFLVNAGYQNGQLSINPSSEPIEALFVVERRQFPSSVDPDEFGVIQEREFARVTKEKGYVEIGDRKYLEVAVRNPFGGPNVVFIDAKRIKPVYIEDFTRTCKNRETRFGLQGFGYFPVPGTEVTEPSKPLAEIREAIK